MKKAAANPMATLQMWDDVCREFGCSEDQIRELYSLPCPAAAPSTETFEDVMDAFNPHPKELRPPIGILPYAKQN